MPSRGRHNTTRGRLFDILDRIRPGVKRSVDIHSYVSPQANSALAVKASELGVTRAGLACAVLEAVARGNLFNAVLDLPKDLPVRKEMPRRAVQTGEGRCV